MARRYVIAILVILLSVGVGTLTVQGAAGASKSSKSSKSQTAHKKKKRVKVVRAPQKLVIRSACAWVEDQQTGELFVQKRATAVLPIASITKLMTAMVTLDAQLDLQELITIEPEDVDTLRHTRSRLRVGTLITRGDALLLALMASANLKKSGFLAIVLSNSIWRLSRSNLESTCCFINGSTVFKTSSG